MDTNKGSSPGEKAIAKFTEMMIARMEELKGNGWKQGWIGGNAFGDAPQNLAGRTYSGANAFFLQMYAGMYDFKTPVFMTFLQATKEKLRINKGATSFPVVYWDLSIKDENGNRVSKEDYQLMSKSQQEKMEVFPFLKAYSVFNIDQTNLEVVNKERYDGLVDKFKAEHREDTQGMYKNQSLDRMVEKQEWVCPIHAEKQSNDAYYTPNPDVIVVPNKSQFKKGLDQDSIYKDGMDYYATMLHEMAHSTGSPTRLNRSMSGKFGNPTYAKEELVAELTAAMVGNSMGFDKRILDNNAVYLDGWISVLKKEPKFIVSVMADVNKASNMIMEKIGEQRNALNQAPSKTDRVKKPGEELLDTKIKGKTLFDLQAKYSQINGQYPTVVDDERTRQIAHRIRQAEEIITAYNANITAAYGEKFLSSEQALSTIIPHAVYSGHGSPNLNVQKQADYVQNSQFEDASIFKMKNGNYAIRASFNGTQLEPKVISTDEKQAYLSFSNGEEKEQQLERMLYNHYKAETKAIGETKQKSMQL